jgi:hypothetical protein
MHDALDAFSELSWTAWSPETGTEKAFAMHAARQRPSRHRHQVARFPPLRSPVKLRGSALAGSRGSKCRENCESLTRDWLFPDHPPRRPTLGCHGNLHTSDRCDECRGDCDVSVYIRRVCCSRVRSAAAHVVVAPRLLTSRLSLHCISGLHLIQFTLNLKEDRYRVETRFSAYRLARLCSQI